MKTIKILCLVSVGFALSACEGGEGIRRIGPDKSVDGGINAHHLSTLVAGVWVDPNGCDHWIIDDGVEGYLSERLQPDGTPVCSGVAEPNTAVGPFKDGTPIADVL
ncbi:hypothetical protein [Aestuariibius sp. HNIBRBA575]|uniref:hypothetical protein n=1 Tax=Aestuariibius sp. HNIBRBA575 TaxID=3233343 RepID=UPI0034A4BD24